MKRKKGTAYLIIFFSTAHSLGLLPGLSNNAFTLRPALRPVRLHQAHQ
jgi:hypothetical protein